MKLRKIYYEQFMNGSCGLETFTFWPDIGSERLVNTHFHRFRITGVELDGKSYFRYPQLVRIVLCHTKVYVGVILTCTVNSYFYTELAILIYT